MATKRETMRANTIKTAENIRRLYQEFKLDHPEKTANSLIDMVTEKAAEKAPSGHWNWIAYNAAKPISRTIVISYLHGWVGAGTDKIQIGPDLVGDLRPKKKVRANRPGILDGVIKTDALAERVADLIIKALATKPVLKVSGEFSDELSLNLRNALQIPAIKIQLSILHHDISEIMKYLELPHNDHDIWNNRVEEVEFNFTGGEDDDEDEDEEEEDDE